LLARPPAPAQPHAFEPHVCIVLGLYRYLTNRHPENCRKTRSTYIKKAPVVIGSGLRFCFGGEVQSLAEVQLVRRVAWQQRQRLRRRRRRRQQQQQQQQTCTFSVANASICRPYIALSKRVARLATSRTNSSSCPAQRQHPISHCHAPCPHLPITAQKGKRRCSRGRINFLMKRPCAAFQRTPMTSALNLFACGRRHSLILTASARSALLPFHLKARAKRRR
jgi:hypothetical protein